jgi:hypothetical protein
MADISELTPFGREPDFVPSKPLGKRQIAKLAADCDRLEHLVSRSWVGDRGRFDLSPDTLPFEKWTALLDRWHISKLKYGAAIHARNLFIEYKAETSTRAVKSSDRLPLESAMYEAQAHLDMIEANRPDFAAERELTDANAAAVHAENLFEIAKTKFDIADRQARADKRNGIRRFRASHVHRH